MRKGKKIVALLTTVIIFVTGIAGYEKAYAAETGAAETHEKVSFSKVEGTKELESLSKRIGNIGSSKVIKDIGYSPEDMVDVIIELKDPSLLENYTYSNQMFRSSANISFDDYVTSSIGKNIHQQLIKNQNTVLDSINNMNAGSKVTNQFFQKSNSISAIFNYTSVLNGFSVRIPYELLAGIKEIPEVKRAYIAPVYDLVKPTMSQSVPFIGADKAWKYAGYKGENTVVAVVDTGLDTSHEAFCYAPDFTKLTQDRIGSILEETELSAEKYGSITSDRVYLSPKLPFVFDYADKDTKVSGGDSHGTHVAGTVAGSAVMDVVEDGAITYHNGVVGVAPEAQLVIMKVFSDTDGGASTVNIMAALDDAVKLGVDVINMSLGSGAGYTYESGQGIEEVYSRITKAGINLAISAGNDYSMSNGNTYQAALASNPDTATVGSPSTYEAALSVASVINKGVYSEYLEAGNRLIGYNDNAVKGKKLVNRLTGSYEYVDAGLGRVEDYANVDVTGKIALVKRGSITFQEKEVNAVSGGAIAVVVYNNAPGTISMGIDQYDIPAVSITLEQGEFLKGLPEKVITIDPSKNTELAGHASDFSSWGVTPDLKLKPEIAAPGEGIYSAVAGGYASYNGTSMASPHIAGVMALMKQYVNEFFGDLSKAEQQIRINQLMMSTAKPMKHFNELPYSPRKQGAGMVQVYNALTSGAYLYVENSDRTKIELGDDVSKAGEYNVEFHIRSVTGSAITYNFDTITITEDVISSNDKLFISESPRKLTPIMSVNADGGILDGSNLIVGPYEDVKVAITIQLSEPDKAYLDQNFENGQFVEGFVYLNSINDVDLSIPFMGFYGDWTKAPIMDSSSLYENGEYSQTSSEAYGLIGNFEYPLGVNLFADDSLPLDENKIAISPNNDGYFDGVKYVATSLLRNARTLDYMITGESGDEVYYYKSEYEIKSFFINNPGYMNFTLHADSWKGLDNAGVTLPNDSTYRYKVTGALDFTNHPSSNVKDSWEFPITIDIESPELTGAYIDEIDGKRYLQLEVKDNQYISFIALYDSSKSELGYICLNEEVKGKSTLLTFDITNVNDNTLDLEAFDYAFNGVEYIIDLSEESILLDYNELTLEVGEEVTLKATAFPDENVTITWSSTNEKVATVTNGLVKGITVGEVIITATTEKGISASCKVTVIEKEKPIPTPTDPPVTPTPTVPPVTPTPIPVETPKLTIDDVTVELSSKKTFYVGTTRNLIVTIPEELKDDLQTITFTSSNTKVATVTKDGKIRGKKPGKVTIKTTVKMNNETKTFKHTLTVKAYIKITNTVKSLKVNDTYTFNAKAYGVSGDISWSVSNRNVAVINKKTGKIRAKRKGTVYVIAKVKNVVKKIKIYIK